MLLDTLSSTLVLSVVTLSVNADKSLPCLITLLLIFSTVTALALVSSCDLTVLISLAFASVLVTNVLTLVFTCAMSSLFCLLCAVTVFNFSAVALLSLTITDTFSATADTAVSLDTL